MTPDTNVSGAPLRMYLEATQLDGSPALDML